MGLENMTSREFEPQKWRIKITIQQTSVGGQFQFRNFEVSHSENQNFRSCQVNWKGEEVSKPLRAICLGILKWYSMDVYSTRCDVPPFKTFMFFHVAAKSKKKPKLPPWVNTVFIGCQYTNFMSMGKGNRAVVNTNLCKENVEIVHIDSSPTGSSEFGKKKVKENVPSEQNGFVRLTKEQVRWVLADPSSLSNAESSKVPSEQVPDHREFAKLCCAQFGFADVSEEIAAVIGKSLWHNTLERIGVVIDDYKNACAIVSDALSGYADGRADTADFGRWRKQLLLLRKELVTPDINQALKHSGADPSKVVDAIAAINRRTKALVKAIRKAGTGEYSESQGGTARKLPEEEKLRESIENCTKAIFNFQGSLKAGASKCRATLGNWAVSASRNGKRQRSSS